MMRDSYRLLSTLALAGAISACGGEGPAGAGGAGGTGTGGATTTTGGGAGGAGTGGAGTGGAGGDLLGQGSLVDRGVLVRYFIDEADSGQTVTQLEDATPDPLPLPLTYGPELSFATDGKNRGLEWTTVALDGRASTPVTGSKVTALQGSTTGTIEVVIDIDEVTSSSSRISHIDFDYEAGRFTLASSSASRLQFRVNGGLIGDCPVSLPALGRAVVHAVLDSSQPDAGARVRMYVNASPLTRVGGSPPSQDEGIDLGTTAHYVLGNREIGVRSFQGRLYYAAMYTSALTEEEVLRNAARLLQGDDRPAVVQ